MLLRDRFMLKKNTPLGVSGVLIGALLSQTGYYMMYPDRFSLPKFLTNVVATIALSMVMIRVYDLLKNLWRKKYKTNPGG